MTTHIFANNKQNKTRQLEVQLFDSDADGSAVWQVSCGEDVRYIEGSLSDEIWEIVDRAANAYEGEEEHGEEYRVCRGA
jgi:hypothetical protein